jgi:predicted enzyme related to lactoylglutathione lyase
MIKFRHAGIVVSNIDRSIDFYKELLNPISIKDAMESGEYIDKFLGLKNVNVRTVKMTLECGGIVELLRFFSHPYLPTDKSITNLGCSHIALTVSDLEETYTKLKGTGTEFINAPHLSPDGLAKVAFCQDPDGTFLELVEEIK